MLTIRLTRKGKKNQPFFRVVVIDKRRSAKGGRPSEILGYIDPLTKRKSLKKDRILHWISVGAQPSSTVHNLLVNEKIIEGKKMSKFNMSKKAAAAIKAKADAAAAPVAEVPAPEVTAPAEAPKESEAPKEEVKPQEAPAA
jgi:small subunit ribosomal protein S16